MPYRCAILAGQLGPLHGDAGTLLLIDVMIVFRERNTKETKEKAHICQHCSSCSCIRMGTQSQVTVSALLAEVRQVGSQASRQGGLILACRELYEQMQMLMLMLMLAGGASFMKAASVNQARVLCAGLCAGLLNFQPISLDWLAPIVLHCTCLMHSSAMLH